MLRQFAGLWVVVFGASAVWQWMVRGDVERAAVMGIIAVTVGPLGLVFPAAIRPIFVAWLIVAFPIGWTVSALTMIAIFLFVMCPIGLLFRLKQRDALELRRQPGRASYWKPKPAPAGPASYLRQF